MFKNKQHTIIILLASSITIGNTLRDEDDKLLKENSDDLKYMYSQSNRGPDSDEPDTDEDIKQSREEKHKIDDKPTTRYDTDSDESQYQNAENHDNQTLALRSEAGLRIVGGIRTSISIHPHNVAISKNGIHWCGGSMIDEQWVLSAGHCFKVAYDGNLQKLAPYVIRAGSSFYNRGGYQARVNKVFFHDNIAPEEFDFDYALIRLDRPMPIGKNLAVVNLPGTEYVVNAGEIINVTGWGSTHPSGIGHLSDRLRVVSLPVMDQDNCQRSYDFTLTPRMLCAGYPEGGKDSCNHDSGGPAVHDGVLLGVVSFGGKQCGDPYSPGVYSKVSEITEWIDAVITNNEARTVKELIPNIEKAKAREMELQRLKDRVEDKKNKILTSLPKNMTAPTIVEIAKQKLNETANYRRSYKELSHGAFIDDDKLDEINLSNLINDRILKEGVQNEKEYMLNKLALHQVMISEKSMKYKSEKAMETKL